LLRSGIHLYSFEKKEKGWNFNCIRNQDCLKLCTLKSSSIALEICTVPVVRLFFSLALHMYKFKSWILPFIAFCDENLQTHFNPFTYGRIWTSLNLSWPSMVCVGLCLNPLPLLYIWPYLNYPLSNHLRTLCHVCIVRDNERRGTQSLWTSEVLSLFVLCFWLTEFGKVFVAICVIWMDFLLEWLHWSWHVPINYCEY
jgi:hypothetical protein